MIDLLTTLEATTSFWWLLIVASFFTAAFTAAVGIGGGTMLVAIMASIFPPGVLIPIHGVVQMGSGMARSFYLRQHIHWNIWPPFVLGAFIGISLGSQVVIALPENTLRIVLAFFILLLCWAPSIKGIDEANPKKKYFWGVMFSSFISMFVGATGPLVKSLLGRDIKEKKSLVGTFSACIVMQHAMKSIAFGMIGFSFAPYIELIALMVLSGFLGGYFGVKILHHLPEKAFRIGYKTVITILALHLLLKGFEVVT